jgi:cytochrome c-type biogenesis protein CcmE
MKKLMIVSLALVASIGVLVWVGVEAASIPVVRIGELKGGTHGGVDVQVDGKVVAIESYSPLRFSIASEKDPENILLVTSERSVPENFNVGRNVSLRGEYQKEKSCFDAYRITTQCPSKYEASKETEKQVQSSAAGGYGSPGSSSIGTPELLEKAPKLAN